MVIITLGIVLLVKDTVDLTLYNKLNIRSNGLTMFRVPEMTNLIAYLLQLIATYNSLTVCVMALTEQHVKTVL